MAVFVHPQGLCESADVGDGTRIWAFAHVMEGASVGPGCNIGDHAFVESGVIIGANVTVKNGVQLWRGVTVEDDAFLGPGCVFTNDRHPRASVPLPAGEEATTIVRQGATVGANATVVAGTVLGRYAFVAAGAVVTGDVADHELVAGVPARRSGWACRCGHRLDDLVCPSCGRAYQAKAEGDGLIESGH